MPWLAPFLIVTSVILQGLSASFLSTIDEYRRIDSPIAHKRHGSDNSNKQYEKRSDFLHMLPLPQLNLSADFFFGNKLWPMAGQRQYGGDVEFGGNEDPSCDVVMAQCQCEDNGGDSWSGGDRSPVNGGDSWSGGDRSPVSPPVVPVPHMQQRDGPGTRKRAGTHQRSDDGNGDGDSGHSRDSRPLWPDITEDVDYGYGKSGENDESTATSRRHKTKPHKRVGNGQPKRLPTQYPKETLQYWNDTMEYE